jgi:molybdate transport system substrate-binding protein
MMKMSFHRLFLSALIGLVPLCALAQGTAATKALPWPAELPAALPAQSVMYIVPKSNYVLDFHGSPQNPDLVIFMAGNQYRAFPELVPAFRVWVKQQPRWAGVPVENIFYGTTPPGRLIDAMASGKLSLGNLWLDVTPTTLWPDVFMTGVRQQQRLRQMGQVDEYYPYAQNRGVVLLVKAGNPKNIRAIDDLARDDVRVVISSPKREPASYENYAAAIDGQGGKGMAERVMAKSTTISPEVVHHRENPQFIADGLADAAPMFWHFGDYLKRSFPDQFDYVQLPKEGNNFAGLTIAVIKTSPRPRAAQAWLEFIQSDVAADIYTRNGFDYATPAERSKAVPVK